MELITEAHSMALIAQTQHEVEMELIEAQGEPCSSLEARFSAATIAKEKKVEAYNAVLNRMDSVEEEFRARADMNMRIARSAKALKSFLRSQLKLAMDILGVTQLHGETIRFSLIKGKTKPVIFDVDHLPKEFFKEVTHLEPDLDKIFTALSAGQEIPGVRLEESSTLRTYAAKKEKNERTSRTDIPTNP